MATNYSSIFYGTTTRTLTTNCLGTTSKYPTGTLIITTKSSNSNFYTSAFTTKKDKDKDEKEKEKRKMEKEGRDREKN